MRSPLICHRTGEHIKSAVSLHSRDTRIVLKVLKGSLIDKDLVISYFRTSWKEAVSLLERVRHIEVYIVLLEISNACSILDVLCRETEIICYSLLRRNRKRRYDACKHRATVHLNNPVHHIP